MSPGPDTTQGEAHDTPPPLVLWLIGLGIGALVLQGWIHGAYLTSGPSDAFEVVALTVVGGVAGPLLIAGLVGVVLHRLGFRGE